MATLEPSSSDDLSTPYDKVPYPSSSFPQSHPNRLAAMARLFGLPAKDPAEARVLELGCADGANLLPMAEQAPRAAFVGVDASRIQIENGKKAIAAAGLHNVELKLQDIMDFPAGEGKFDYIIAHGLFSWVKDPVRDKILAICAEHLTEHGVAYISYNAHPGGSLRQALRDMMLFHTRTIGDPTAKVQQARALLSFLAESVPPENSAYGMLLKSELTHFGGLPDSFLLHDILEEENTSFYFHEFISWATKHGLQYLSEPNLAEMVTTNFPEKIRATLSQLNNQLVAQEQYMDFLRNRSFRQTLLCRSNLALKRNLVPADFKQFSIRSLLQTTTGPVELVPGVVVGFATKAGVQVSSSDAFVKALLWTLTETKGVSVISFADLLASSRARSRPFLGELSANRDQIDELTLQTNLLNLAVKGLVELHASPVGVRTNVVDRPMVSKLARYQALNARLITNRIHQPVPADMPSRYVMAASDGVHTRDEITAELVDRVIEGKLQINEGSVRVTEPEKLRGLLSPIVDVALKAIASGGFFAP